MTRSRKRKINKKQTGGIVAGLSTTYFESLPSNSSHSAKGHYVHANDCVPKAMDELGLVEKSRFFASCFPEGVGYNAIITLLDTAYPESDGHHSVPFAFHDIDGLTANLNSRLQPGDAILAGYTGKQDHMFIIFREGEVLKVREPQAARYQAKQIFELHEYLKYIEDIGIETIHLIYPNNGHRISIIPQMDDPLKGRRITGAHIQGLGESGKLGLYDRSVYPHNPDGPFAILAKEKKAREAEAERAKNEVSRQWESEVLRQAESKLAKQAEAKRAEAERAKLENDWYKKRRGAEFEPRKRPMAPYGGGTRKTKKKKRRSSGVSRKRRG